MQYILKPFKVLAILVALMMGSLACKDEPDLVDIPDEAFLNALIDLGIDRDGDGAICTCEAGSVSSLDLPPMGITDLTGIESFINLDSLSVDVNPLVVLDLSGNPGLLFLDCHHCELVNIELSGNPALEELHCEWNSLTGLDLSGNPSLRILTCNNNLLEELQLFSNPMLETMISCGNSLEQLDISGNSSLVRIGIGNMPMLQEVCVWILPFPPAEVTVLLEDSPNVEFSTGCGISG
jgi:hypothetical protein